MKRKGIDVSKHQGIIDWKKVKNDGVEFAIIRIGYGGSAPVKDAKFEENYKNARANGLDVGVYIYSYADTLTDAKTEANAVINWLGGRDLELPVYFDIEDKKQSILGNTLRTNIVKTFCEMIEGSGYWAGIYANKSWLTSKLNMSELNAYTVWVAQWANTNTYKGPYAMWQYTSDGSVNGISGRVDMNYQVKELGGKLGISGGSTSSKKSNEEIANEVIAGKWGNGTDRKNRLTSAGYNYDTIQAIVNQKMGATGTSYYKKYTGSSVSLVDALKSIGVDSSMTNRKKIAKANGISNYTGTSSQNTKLLNLLKQGKLKK